MMAHAEDWPTVRKVPKVRFMARDDNLSTPELYVRLGDVTDPIVEMRGWLVEPAMTPPVR